jgi:hypothetical protein
MHHLDCTQRRVNEEILQWKWTFAVEVVEVAKASEDAARLSYGGELAVKSPYADAFSIVLLQLHYDPRILLIRAEMIGENQETAYFFLGWECVCDIGEKMIILFCYLILFYFYCIKNH